jgi:hypothetical protein
MVVRGATRDDDGGDNDDDGADNDDNDDDVYLGARGVYDTGEVRSQSRYLVAYRRRGRRWFASQQQNHPQHITLPCIPFHDGTSRQ